MNSKYKYLIIILIVISFLIWKIIEGKRNYDYQFSCGVSPTLINDIQEDSLGVQLVLNTPYKWNKDILRVFFMDTKDDELKTNTIQIANTWSKYSNIQFELSSSIYRSDIRVSFFEKYGYASALGIQAKEGVFMGNSTLWLQNLHERSSSEFKRVVLHEFGHAIGLEHELQSPGSNIEWDSTKVYKYYNEVCKWDSIKVSKNIFTKIDTEDYSKFDSKSIMIYAVPDSLTKNHKAIPWPSGL